MIGLMSFRVDIMNWLIKWTFCPHRPKFNLLVLSIPLLVAPQSVHYKLASETPKKQIKLEAFQV